MRRFSVLAAPAAVIIAVLTAPAASAAKGDGPQGQVEQGPDHANSICSFSGLNDEPDHPEEGGQVQSYGQIVAAGGKDFAPSPGMFCNGHKFPYPEAFGGPH